MFDQTQIIFAKRDARLTTPSFQDISSFLTNVACETILLKQQSGLLVLSLHTDIFAD